MVEPNMTVEDVRERLERIKQAAGDPEVAHGREDSLREDVLRHIANGWCSDPMALAHEVLKSEEIDFPRWYA
jgi:hypothetical protein